MEKFTRGMSQAVKCWYRIHSAEILDRGEGFDEMEEEGAHLIDSQTIEKKCSAISRNLRTLYSELYSSFALFFCLQWLLL